MALTPNARPNTAMPIGRPIATTEPNATTSTTTAATRPISSPVPVSPSSKAANSSPRASTCNPPAPSRPATVSFSRSRSPASSSSMTGYCRPISATVPSGDSVVLTPITFGKAATSAWRPSSAARASGAPAKVAPATSGVATTCAVSPARSEPARDSTSTACWESNPGTSKLSSRSRPTVAEAVPTTTAASAHAAITTQGRWAA